MDRKTITSAESPVYRVEDDIILPSNKRHHTSNFLSVRRTDPIKTIRQQTIGDTSCDTVYLRYRRFFGYFYSFGILCCLLVLAQRADAGWGNAGPGIVHIPIAAEGAFSLSGKHGGYIGVTDALTGPIPAAELAELRKHDPFKGKTDEEILAKMRAIRKQVDRAIGLMSSNPDLRPVAACLEQKFFLRQLCIEFSNRKIGGVIQGSRLGEDKEKIAGSIFRGAGQIFS